MNKLCSRNIIIIWNWHKDDRELRREQEVAVLTPVRDKDTYSSQMGKFMNDVFSFSYTHKVEHDDSIDSIATFCDKLIVAPKANTKAQVLYV